MQNLTKQRIFSVAGFLPELHLLKVASTDGQLSEGKLSEVALEFDRINN